MAEHVAVLKAHQLTKTYESGPTVVEALTSANLRVNAGSMTVITGRSGSGKTTLLNLLGTLDEPTAGSVELDGRVISAMSDTERAVVRRNDIGFIFQSFGLLPMLSALENVEVPMRLDRLAPSERMSRARELLALVGLDHRSDHRPNELSGGEQQRVAIARSLANRPRLLLADEPTGQLDSQTGAEITAVIADLVREQGIAAVVVTHDATPLSHADQVLALTDGALAETSQPMDASVESQEE